MRATVVLLAALGATLVGTASTGDARVRAEGGILRSVGAEPTGAIAYVRGPDEWSGDIYVTSVDGSRTRRLTRTRALVGSVAASPDGRRIAFDRRAPGRIGRSQRAEIWTMDASGGGDARRLTHGSSDSGPAWSSDGRRILFSRYVSDKTGWATAIFSVDPEGASPRGVTSPSPDDHGTCDFDPVWWPRRRAVIFVRDSYCDDGFGSEFGAVDASGRPITVLAPVAAAVFDYVTSPDLSADGRFVVFDASTTVNPDKPEGIYLARPEGIGVLRRVTGDGDSPAWSPDGRWIAFVRSGDVWIVRPDGSGARRITRTRGVEQSPDWLPPR